MNDVYENMSKALYERFVVNPNVVAVQKDNGAYAAVRTPITIEMIKMMLIGGFSLGTYQQQYKNDKLRWICFDFDAKKKENNQEELNELKEKHIIPFINGLKKKGLKYLIEFSGRRGFHIWLFFNQLISKDLGYSIIQYLLMDNNIIISEDSFWGLDLFPKTRSCKVPNKYGLQVKIPLSRHQASGTYSYFVDDIEKFEGKIITEIDCDFLEAQKRIIESVEENDPSDFSFLSNIEKEECVFFHKQIIIADTTLSIADIKAVFFTDKALKVLWNRISFGELNSFERMMIVGIFGHINNGIVILNELFRMQKNYKINITNTMITKYRNNMFPITFKYLYQYLNIFDCPDEKKNLFVDDYIYDTLNIPVTKIKITDAQRKISFIESIVSKEINYFYYNDEVYDFDILNQLKGMSLYDYSEIEKYIDGVEKGEKKRPDSIKYRRYIRKEKNKDRTLLSLEAKERVITTALITKLIHYCQKDYDSYSYHVNLGFEGDVFYPWISSWTRFKNDISQFFSIPFFEEFACLKLDLKHFYDSIYLHGTLQEIAEKDCLNDKKEAFTNIYKYLLEFNEHLMLEISNSIQGVPQGPAYARVLAELTADSLINQFKNNNPQFKELKLYRYVDDMFIFGQDRNVLNDFLSEFSGFFESKNLFLNKEKTRNYGKIKELYANDKTELREFIEFNYDIIQLRNNSWISDYEKEKFDSIYLRFINRKKEWDINDANLIFSDVIDNSVKDIFYSQFYTKMLTTEIGRGNMFRKFYDYIFSDAAKTRKFFDNYDFRKVPSKTINYDNLVCSMILHFSELELYLDIDIIEKLRDFLINDISENNKYLLELLNYHERGLDNEFER